ncbi:SDR family NAD(P)-dependent oxidoreductase [Dehalobacterium formicoaceticum]|uniref:SDR family NAD(P)-dependent oxidoreductase n=1 Tax=Dehalobacterium formicoaceticum TaxID=51515 RepID=UPI000B7E4641|nr:SDR family oxidoreductase [Dehalobacterium formicoaceticum]
MINPMDLSEKLILVTGASSGIGRATAIQLSKLGGKIVLVARSEDKLNETLKMMEGEGHAVYPFDLKGIDKIEGLINQIVQENGALNGLVHCAGIAPMRPLGSTKYDFLHDVMVINFYSFVEVVRCASKKKKFVEGASFIGMSSVGSQSGDKSKIAYCASKAAMDAAIKCMAKELESKKIRVNTVVGGFVKTDMYSAYVDNAGEETFDMLVLGRQYQGMGEPLDIANAMAYLLSDASKFITGTGFVVDGGYLS